MQKISLSNEIYNKCIKENAKVILQELSKAHPNDGTFEVSSSKSLLPELVAIILKAGFDMYLFVSDDANILNNAEIYCKKENEIGVIRQLCFESGFNKKDAALYEEKIKSFLEAEECKKILNEILEEISN